VTPAAGATGPSEGGCGSRRGPDPHRVARRRCGKRIQRGSLGKELGQDGRVYVYVYLDLSQDMSHHESQAYCDPVVEELVEQVATRWPS
jgi:hypothetical protein